MTGFDGSELVHWRELPPDQRRPWWEATWEAAIALSGRYRVALRSGWWADAVQVEALAAFHAWLRLYDTGAYTDPPGKLQLLWELDRLRAVLRAGEAAFAPATDRVSFDAYLAALEGDSPPPAGDTGDPIEAHADDELAAALHAITERLAELRERETLLADDQDATVRDRSRADHQGTAETAQLRAAIDELVGEERTLRARIAHRDSSTAP